MKITKEFNNKLFGRKEILAEIPAEQTPSKKEVAKMISEKFGKPEENITVKEIRGMFGSKVFGVEAEVYEDVKIREALKPREGKKEAGAEKAPAKKK